MRLLHCLPLFLLAAMLSAQVPPRMKRTVRQIEKDLDRYDAPELSETERDSLEAIQDRLIKGWMQVLSDSSSASLDLANVWKGNWVSTTHSPDGRLWIFAIDERSGGTYQPSINMVQVRDKEGHVSAWVMEDENDPASTAWFGELQPLNDSTYFCRASVKTCATCIAEFALQLTVDGTHCYMDSIASYDGRFYNLEHFTYDPVTKTVSLAYQTSPDGAGDDADEHPHRITASYRYRDGEFVEVESCSHLIDP